MQLRQLPHLHRVANLVQTYFFVLCNVACCTNLLNDFSYEICQMPVQAKTTASPVMVTKNDLHIVEERLPFEAQNNIIGTQKYSTELYTQ